MEERSVNVDHATLNRRVVRYSPLIAREAHRRKSATGRMDGAYIKLRFEWKQFYETTGPKFPIVRDGSPRSSGHCAFSTSREYALFDPSGKTDQGLSS